MSDQPISSTIINTILGFFFAKAKEVNRAKARARANGGFIKGSERRKRNTVKLGAFCHYLARSWNRGEFYGRPQALSNFRFADTSDLLLRIIPH